MKVDPDKFLTELNRMFERHEKSGSVYVTLKRCRYRTQGSCPLVAPCALHTDIIPAPLLCSQ